MFRHPCFYASLQRVAFSCAGRLPSAVCLHASSSAGSEWHAWVPAVALAGALSRLLEQQASRAQHPRREPRRSRCCCVHLRAPRRCAVQRKPGSASQRCCSVLIRSAQERHPSARRHPPPIHNAVAAQPARARIRPAASPGRAPPRARSHRLGSRLDDTRANSAT